MTNENQENPTNHNNSDEIDLRDLIIALWEGKWTILACVLLAMAVAVAYIKLVPQTYKGQIPIKALTSSQMLAYQMASKIDVMPITSEALATEFTLSIANAQPLEQSSAVITSVGVTGKHPNWVISFNSKQPQQAKDAWKSALHDYSSLTKDSLAKQFDAAVASQSQEQRKAIARLQDQIHLAKVAGIEINTSPGLEAISLPYLRGYKVLEAEVALLEKQITHFENLPKQANPFSQANLMPVNYSVATISLQPKLKPTLLLALSFILGGMLGVMILIVRNVVRQP